MIGIKSIAHLIRPASLGTRQASKGPAIRMESLPCQITSTKSNTKLNQSYNTNTNLLEKKKKKKKKKKIKKISKV